MSADAGARIVQVFRSALTNDMYLIVDKAAGLRHVPEALLGRFGRPEPSIVFRLTPERTLARADAATVLEAIEAQGFFLQMPPPVDPDAPHGGDGSVWGRTSRGDAPGEAS